MKKIQLVLSVAAIFVDYALLIAAGFVAYLIRFAAAVQEVRPVIFDLPQREYLVLTALVALVWLIMFALVGLYTTTYRQRATAELARIVLGCSLGFLAIITFLFWSRELFSSRFIMLVAWILAIVFVSVGRIVLRFIRRWLLAHNIGVTSVILIGSDNATKRLAQAFERQPVWGFRVVSILPEFHADHIASTVSQQTIDELIFVDVTLEREQHLQAYEFCIQHHLGFRYVPDMFEAQSHNVVVQTIGGVPVIAIQKTPLDGWGRIVKRLFDLMVSTIGIIVLSPLLLLIALSIRLESKGPVIYKNERVGKNGKLFNTYKFRYMKLEYCTGPLYDKEGRAAQVEQELIKKQSQRQGGLYKIINDPRKTRVGYYLEKFSLDELPQLFNVWIGNMSFVGPRPHQEREVKQFPKNHERVQAIKPGITGLAQISGRSDLDVEEELKLDTFYIENWSLANDINILLRTPFALFKKRGN